MNTKNFFSSLKNIKNIKGTLRINLYSTAFTFNHPGLYYSLSELLQSPPLVSAAGMFQNSAASRESLEPLAMPHLTSQRRLQHLCGSPPRDTDLSSCTNPHAPYPYMDFRKKHTSKMSLEVMCELLGSTGTFPQNLPDLCED